MILLAISGAAIGLLDFKSSLLVWACHLRFQVASSSQFSDVRNGSQDWAPILMPKVPRLCFRALSFHHDRHSSQICDLKAALA